MKLLPIYQLFASGERASFPLVEITLLDYTPYIVYIFRSLFHKNGFAMEALQTLKETYQRLIEGPEVKTFRYLYDSFTFSDRLIGLIGPRGVGKTTLMLQLIRNRLDPLKAFYCSADHIGFSVIKLWDMVEELVKKEDIRYFFIDEIHKYPGWNQELKNIYDSFPDVTVVFSGSSSLDLVKGRYDLSRRGTIHHLSGLSFREYLSFQTGKSLPTFPFQELLSDHQKISKKLARTEKILGFFEKYLDHGYYPFGFDSSALFKEKMVNVVEKTIFTDIAGFYQLKTQNLQLFKKILLFSATTPPGTINVHSLAKNLGIDDKTILHYLKILKETGLVRLLFSHKTDSALIRKPEKIYLDNPSLYSALVASIGKSVNKGTLRELFFLSSLENIGQGVTYGGEKGDFQVGALTFEIGGKNKKTPLRESLRVVKDNILVGDSRTIPLYLFGFLY